MYNSAYGQSSIIDTLLFPLYLIDLQYSKNIRTVTIGICVKIFQSIFKPKPCKYGICITAIRSISQYGVIIIFCFFIPNNLTGVYGYEWCIGSRSGYCDKLPFTWTSEEQASTGPSLDLKFQEGHSYFVTVKVGFYYTYIIIFENPVFNPSNAEATFVQSTRMQRKPSTTCQVGVHWIPLTGYLNVSTHVPGSSHLLDFCIILYLPN